MAKEIKNELLTQIKADNLTARKTKDKVLSSILTLLVSEIDNIGINDGKRDTTEEETIKVLQKFKKNASENALAKEKLGGTKDEIKVFNEESLVYESYLPKLMSEDELKTAIEVMVKDGANNIGVIMGKLKKEYGGQYDGGMASEIAKSIL